MSALLEVHNLRVGIESKNAAKCFCDALNFSINAGESLAILGRNGTGKSTLLAALAGFLPPQKGEILLAGKTYEKHPAKDAAKLRGFLAQQQEDAFAATVLETALIGRHPHLERFGWESAKDLQIAQQALVSVGLFGLEARDIRTLSGGERQRLAIATLLTQNPRLYLLDEPMSHLDLAYQMNVLELFRKAQHDTKIATIMVLHEPALAYRFFDRVLLMYGDAHAEIIAAKQLSAEKLSWLYDYPLEMLRGKTVSFAPR